MKTKKKIPISLSAAAVLLCLVLVSAHFTSGMYARFTTGASDSGAGRFAAFNVSATAEDGTVVIDENGTGEYVVKITNPGEVAVRYKAVLAFDETYAGLFDSTKLDRVLEGELAPGMTAEEELTFSFDMSGVSTTGPGTVPFTVTVTFTQID